MWALGIDIAKRKHLATLLDNKGKKVFKHFAFTNTMDGVNLLFKKPKETDTSKENLLIGMEAISHIANKMLLLFFRFLRIRNHMRFILFINIWALSNWGLTFYRLSLSISKCSKNTIGYDSKKMDSEKQHDYNTKGRYSVISFFFNLYHNQRSARYCRS